MNNKYQGESQPAALPRQIQNTAGWNVNQFHQLQLRLNILNVFLLSFFKTLPSGDIWLKFDHSIVGSLAGIVCIVSGRI